MAEERLAPVQGYSAGIPWSMHMRAYDAYCAMYGKQQALIEGNCRGGFGVNELDDFIPGWREELSELHQLRAIIDRVRNYSANMRSLAADDEGRVAKMCATVADSLDRILAREAPNV